MLNYPYLKLILLTTFLVFFLFIPFLIFGSAVNIYPSNNNVSPGNHFTISINIKDVFNLFGAAFDLLFNPNIISFVSVQKGTFLEQDGAATDLLAVVNPPGNLIVGYSRQAVGGVATGVSGSGTLMTITFRALSVGTSNLTFQNNSLCNPTGIDCVVISTTWSNGTVMVMSDTIPPAPPTGVTVR